MAMALAGTVLLGGISLDANAATLTRTMNWVGYGVTITTQTSVAGDTNYASLFVYNKKVDKGGSCITSKIGKSLSSAWVVITNSQTKSAKGVHYATDCYGKTTSYYTYTKNKGTNYSVKN